MANASEILAQLAADRDRRSSQASRDAYQSAALSQRQAELNAMQQHRQLAIGADQAAYEDARRVESLRNHEDRVAQQLNGVRQRRAIQSIADNPALAAQLLGGGRRGGYPPPGAPSVAGMGPVGSIEIRGGDDQVEYSQNGPSLAEAQQYAAMQQQTAGEIPGVLASLAKGDGPDARMARQMLGVPVGAEQSPAQYAMLSRQFSDLLGPPQTPAGSVEGMKTFVDSLPPSASSEFNSAAAPHVRAQMRRAAADWAAISEQMGKPGVTSDQIADMQQQFMQRHKGLSEMPPTPISPEQAADLKKQIKLSEYQEQMPGVPLDFDKDGNVRVVPGYTELERAKSQATTAAESSARATATARFNSRMKVLKAALPPQPEITASPAEREAYNQAQAKYVRDQQAAYDEFEATMSGGQPPTEPPPAAPADSAAQLPPVQVGSGLVAERAFAAGRLRPGQPFTFSGMTFTFDNQGRASRTQ